MKNTLSKYNKGDIVCFSFGLKEFPPYSNYSIGKIIEIDNLGIENNWWYNLILPDRATTAQIHRCMIGENAIHCRIDELEGLFV